MSKAPRCPFAPNPSLAGAPPDARGPPGGPMREDAENRADEGRSQAAARGPNFARQFAFLRVCDRRMKMTFQVSAMVAGVGEADRAAPPSARAGARGLAFGPPPDREKAFARARRRSGRVRLLRKAILVGGLGAVVAMVGIAIFNPFAAKFGSLSFSALSVEGTKITMAKPKLAGFRGDGQPYSLTAEKALQDVKHPTIVELQNLTGDIGMSDGEAMHIRADSGVYDSASEKMLLSDNIWIGNARFDVRLRTADIDFKTGVYQSDEPVEVHVGEGTTIFGDHATARNNGQEFTFEGHVRTRMIPQADSAAGENSKGGTQ